MRSIRLHRLKILMNTNDLSIHDLRAIITVARTRHFGNAADELGLAQPTLSAQVQKVERVLGVTFFERAARRFLITPQGERLLPIVREMLASAERLQQASAQHVREVPLRLGVIPTLGPYLMPHVLVPMATKSPGFTLDITERPTATLIEKLLDGSLDAAILSLPVRNSSLAALPLFDEAFRLIAPRGSELTCCACLSPAQLAASDMVLLDEGHCLREQVVSACNRKGGTQPRVVAASLETLKYMVAAGSGYSLLPALACGVPEGLRDLVQVRAFDDRPVTRRVALCYRRTLADTRRVLQLADFMRKHPPKEVQVVGAVAKSGQKVGLKKGPEKAATRTKATSGI